MPNHTRAENLKKLFTVKDRKFKFSARDRYLVLFVVNGTEVKIPSEIKPPLMVTLAITNFQQVNSSKMIDNQLDMTNLTYLLRKAMSGNFS